MALPRFVDGYGKPVFDEPVPDEDEDINEKVYREQQEYLRSVAEPKAPVRPAFAAPDGFGLQFKRNPVDVLDTVQSSHSGGSASEHTRRSTVESRPPRSDRLTLGSQSRKPFGLNRSSGYDVQFQEPPDQQRPSPPAFVRPGARFGLRSGSNESDFRASGMTWQARGESSRLPPVSIPESSAADISLPRTRRFTPARPAPTLRPSSHADEVDHTLPTHLSNLDEPNGISVEVDGTLAVASPTTGDSITRGPWQPVKKLTFSAMAGLRALHQADFRRFNRSELSERFGISEEAVRRVLKSSWRDGEAEDAGAGGAKPARWTEAASHEEAQRQRRSSTSLRGTKWDQNPGTSVRLSPVPAIMRAFVDRPPRTPSQTPAAGRAAAETAEHRGPA